MSQHDELKRAAEAVNQTYADLCEHGGDELAEAWDSAEIAYDDAANPDVVLALIAENEHFALCAKQWEAAAMQWGGERDQLKAEVAGLRTGYQAYERVNAELKAEVEALRNGMVQIIEMNRMHAECQYGDPDKAESWSCVTVARAAMGKGEQS